VPDKLEEDMKRKKLIYRITKKIEEEKAATRSGRKN